MIKSSWRPRVVQVGVKLWSVTLWRRGESPFGWSNGQGGFLLPVELVVDGVDELHNWLITG